MGSAGPWAVAIALAYLIGSIPFGYIVARAKGIDIRAHGSGNIGATNVGRVLGKRFGRAVFFLDFLKGALPVVGAGLALGPLRSGAPDAATAGAWVGVAVAAVLGHVFPIYLRFKGGKGVATTFGALTGLWPVVTIPCVVAMIVWVAVFKTLRYVSVASCAAAVAVPIGVTIGALAGLTTPATGPGALRLVWPFILATGVIAALVIVRHRSNLARVRAGTEPRYGRPRSANHTDAPTP